MLSLLKRLVPRSLLGRSLLIIILPLILTQVIATWVFYNRHFDNITQRLSDGVAGDIAAVIRIMGPQPTPGSRTSALRLAKVSFFLDVTFHDEAKLPEGHEQFKPDNIVESKLSKALHSRMPYAFIIDTAWRDKQIRVDVQLPDGVLEVFIPRNRLFSSTTYIFIVWMVGSAIVLFGLATIFMRYQVRPLRRLAMVADAYGKGRDAGHVKVEGASEVRLVAKALTRMRTRINRQVRQRTEMLAGVSHDLRTPLTRMKLHLALLGKNNEVDHLQADVAEMERMVDGYLAFARGEGAEQPERTDLSRLLHDLVDQMDDAESEVSLQVKEPIVMPLRPEAMRRCLANLIGNAKRNARMVSVRTKLRKNKVEIMIDDDGPGIPEARRRDVFRPFFRLDESRNPDAGGAGLGLTIARDVVRSHGGDVVLEDAPQGGLRARIWLPV
ncbi:MAG: ATP-binding protein [Kiloniellales bacterium]|nr:ATP-binding protein [Kiloniellales bacterium]